MFPYDAWVFKLDGQLARAPYTENLRDFSVGEICLVQVQVEEFCGFVFASLDPDVASHSKQSGNLETEVRHWVPDVDRLTFDSRLNYDIKSN